MKKLLSILAVMTVLSMIAISCGDKKVDETIPVSEVKVTPLTGNVAVGATMTLVAEVLPANATNKTVTWSTLNPEIATVDQSSGVVTGIKSGEAVILAKAGKKTGQAAITVTAAVIPVMENISTPYLKEIAGSTVQMTAENFLAGDKVRLEDYFGYSSGDIDIKDVTATGAAFDLPTGAPKDRTLKLTVMRSGAAICVDYIKYDDQTTQMAVSLGYALTAANEVVADGSVATIHGSVVRQGYVTPAGVFQYNETNGTFDAAAADLKLCTFSTSGTVDLQYVMGVADLSGMKHFDLSGVTSLNLSNTKITELDMTLFPKCKTLLAWGDPGLGEGRIKRVNFGTTGIDPVSKLEHIQLERNQITGPIDVRNCPNLTTKLNLNDNLITGEIDIRNCTKLLELGVNNNQIESINMGSAQGKETDPAMLILYSISAKNNLIREFDTSNCGRLRQLWLEGNKIERIKLLNNALGETPNSPKPDSWFPYMYILKNKADFTISWATAVEAEGRERHIHVEHYWYRNLSGGNKTENGEKESYNKWVTKNPVMMAYTDGFKVTDWFYATEDGGGVRIKHEHAAGGAICAAEQDVE